MIFKFLQGGNTPYTTYNPVVLPTANTELQLEATENSKKEKKEDKNAIDLLKDLNGLVKDVDGLPNDSAYFAKFISKLAYKLSLGEDVDIASLGRLYSLFWATSKAVLLGKLEYIKAQNEVIKNNGYNEVAITPDGSLVATDKETGKMQFISLNEAKKNKDKYTLLTNSELLSLRAESPSQILNNKVLQVVQNGIGLETVLLLIKLLLNDLAISEYKTTGYASRKSGKILEGVEYINQLKEQGFDIGTMGVDGIYKVSLITKTNADKVKNALTAIYTLLPNNAKTLLQIKTGSEDGALTLIGELLSTKVVNSKSYDLNLTPENDSKSKSKSKSNGDEEIKLKNDPVINFIQGTGYSENVDINTGNSINMQLKGRFSILTDKNGEALGANSTLEDVSRSAYAPVLNLNLATFGGVKLDSKTMDKVILDNSDIIGLDLPIDKEKYKQGIITPDLNLTSRIEKAEDEIIYNKLTDPDLINKVYEKYKLPPKFIIKLGLYALNTLEYRRFARILATVDDKYLPENYEDITDGTVRVVSDSNLIDNITEILKSKDKNFTHSNSIFGLFGSNYLEGAIYIPVRENFVAATLGANNYLNVLNVNEVEEVQAERDFVKSNYVKPASLSTLK